MWMITPSSRVASSSVLGHSHGWCVRKNRILYAVCRESGSPRGRGARQRVAVKCDKGCGREEEEEGQQQEGRRGLHLDRRRMGLQILLASLSAAGNAANADTEYEKLSDEEWRKRLTREQYKVLRQAGTELPFSSPLYTESRQGTFCCAGCGSRLFESSSKYNSGTGWPSFTKAVDGAVDESMDLSIAFMPRTEVTCHRCHGHLGHVFPDGPPPTGLRYCMNGVALAFVPGGDAM